MAVLSITITGKTPTGEEITINGDTVAEVTTGYKTAYSNLTTTPSPTPTPDLPPGS